MEIDKAIKCLKQSSTMIYVGGYDGHVAENYLNEKFFTMHLIEACPKNYRIMERRFHNNIWVKCHNLAIAGGTRGMMLNVCHFSGKKGSSGSNSIFKNHLKKSKMISVQGMSMDDFIKKQRIKHVDLLKLNCEGAEYKIFPGEFLDITDMIAVSFHAKNKFFNGPEFIEKRQSTYQLLEEKGFKLIMGEKLLKSKRHINQLWKRS